MNETLTSKIKDLFAQENLYGCKLKFDNTGFCCYILEENAINMDMKGLKREYLDFVENGVVSCSFDDYAIITFLHEVGHAKDNNLKESKIEKKKIRKLMIYSQTEEQFNCHLHKYMECVMNVERKAWNYVFNKNLIGLHEEVMKISNHCLDLYSESWRDIEKYFKPAFN